MANGGIWGDGQRGGIFGAKVDPRLQAELERRAGYRQAYTTALSPMQELKFRDWKQRFAPNDSGEDYDLRGAFKAGFQPDPETGHWPDTFKKPNHPTFSDQSVYARDRPDLAGSWNGDTYVPAQQTQQRIAGAFEASQPVRQVDELSAPITLPFAARNQLGDWGPRMPNVLKTIADPRTSPLGPAAIARMFFDPAGEAGQQVETGRQLAEPFTQFNDPDVDPVKQGTDLALTVMGGSAAVPAEANSLRMGIKAYHGSPHDFERFDSSKIGTGEGAQAYGHGLYFGEREGVAKEYRDSLTTMRQAKANSLLDRFGGDVDAAIAEARAQIDRLNNLPNAGNDAAKRDRFIAIQEEKLAELNALKQSGSMSKGRMYEVDIAADPEQFLDWDKPLSEQSPQVQETLGKQGVRVPDGLTQLPSGRWAPTSGGEVVGRPDGWPTKGDAQTASQMIVEGLPKTGEQIYRQAAKEVYAIRGAKDQRWEPTGKSFEESLAMVGGDHSRVLRMRSGGGKDSADALREAGIPGIRYLDQGSRGLAMYDVGSPRADFGPYTPYRTRADAEEQLALLKRMGETDAEIREIGKQTSNYVVFDDKLISILKKYGLPFTAAGLAALSQLHPKEAQAAQKQKGR